MSATTADTMTSTSSQSQSQSPPADDRTRHQERSRTELTMRALDDIGLGELLELKAFADVDRDTVEAAVGEFVRFMDEVVAPTDQIGDRIGNVHDAETGSVTTPPGFREAYRQFVEGGWGAVPFPVSEGGGGFPRLVGTALQEIFASANMGLSLCPSLTQSGIELLTRWGTEAQQATYLPKLLTGEWNGTMQITEPDAGSDVGAIRTSAEQLDDGTWSLHGTKIFISWGEHDMTDNIVHMVLARTPGSPKGTKGLSLFVVPKFRLDPDGRPGESNGVKCLSIEHKMGLHASPTCVIELDGAVGELVGPEHGGIRAMFTMMNPARLSIGLQGLSVGEAAYTESRLFASERRQGTSGPGSGTVSIDQHADVRRMLSLMRSTLDAMRLVIYDTAFHTDLAASGETSEVRERSQEMVELLTPIAKAWTTDLGVEIASLGVQVHGGMGFIEETRAPQRFRDSRIGPIYEGTNGIQAIDLISRKLPMRDGEVMAELLTEMDDLAGDLNGRGGDWAVLG
ncbi:MAG: acyl-CoA dehydrogenase family protein, partial [Microthrixaceae bacterium]